MGVVLLPPTDPWDVSVWPALFVVMFRMSVMLSGLIIWIACTQGVKINQELQI